MDAFGLDSRWETVRVPNPEWNEINDALTAMTGPAGLLSAGLDQTVAGFAGALASVEGDRIGVELAGWRQSAQRASEAAVQEMNAMLDSTPVLVEKRIWVGIGVG